MDVSNYAKYPFGFGLSFSAVSYDNLHIDTAQIDAHQTATVSITVKNEGKQSVTETVQLYVRDMVGEVVRPVKELKDFQQVVLAAGEAKEVTFTINESQLRYVHSNQQWASDTGEFKIMVGPNSRDLQETTLRLV